MRHVVHGGAHSTELQTMVGKVHASVIHRLHLHVAEFFDFSEVVDS